MSTRVLSTVRAATGAALAISVAWTGMVQPAHATDPTQYDLITDFNGNGAAVATGNVFWLDGGAASIWGHIEDICPGDKHGAYLAAHLFYFDGTSSWTPVGDDTNGCDNGAMNYGKLLDNNGKRIKSIVLLLAEKNAETGDVNDIAHVELDNPTN
jgi:hypothetical protein